MDRIRRVKKKVAKKRAKSVKQWIPIESGASLFGKMKGTVHIAGDILVPIDESWDAQES